MTPFEIMLLCIGFLAVSTGLSVLTVSSFYVLSHLNTRRKDHNSKKHVAVNAVDDLRTRAENLSKMKFSALDRR